MRCGEHVAQRLPHGEQVGARTVQQEKRRRCGLARPQIHHIQNRAGDRDRLSLRLEAALEQGNTDSRRNRQGHQRRDKGS